MGWQEWLLMPMAIAPLYGSMHGEICNRIDRVSSPTLKMGRPAVTAENVMIIIAVFLVSGMMLVALGRLLLS
jgi:hypothetical protein